MTGFQSRMRKSSTSSLGIAGCFIAIFGPLSACAPSIAAQPDASQALSISDLGARPASENASPDNHDAIQQAFNKARALHRPVAIPAGDFFYRGVLIADGIEVFGQAESSSLHALDGANEAIVLTGKGARLRNLIVFGSGSTRLSTFESGAVWVREAEDAAVDHVRIQGSSSVGVVIDDSSRVLVSNNLIEGTQADSIHLTNGSHNIRVEANRVLNSGDDGISVVSYRGQPIVHDVVIASNEVTDNRWGRGISVVGGEHVTIAKNTIKGGDADRAGIYLAAEEQWNTSAVRDIQVSGNTLEDAGGRSSGHGAVTIYNSAIKNLVNENIVIDGNIIRNPRAAPVLITGDGPQQIVVRGNRIYMQARGQVVTNAGARSRVSEADNLIKR